MNMRRTSMLLRYQRLQSCTSGRVNYHEPTDDAQYNLCFHILDKPFDTVNCDYFVDSSEEKGGLSSGFNIGMYRVYPQSFTWVFDDGNI